MSNRDVQNKLIDMKRKMANINDDFPLDWRMESRDMQVTNMVHEGFKLDKTIYNGPSESSIQYEN